MQIIKFLPIVFLVFPFAGIYFRKIGLKIIGNIMLLCGFSSKKDMIK